MHLLIYQSPAISMFKLTATYVNNLEVYLYLAWDRYVVMYWFHTGKAPEAFGKLMVITLRFCLRYLMILPSWRFPSPG